MPVDIVELAARIRDRSLDRGKSSWPRSDPERFLLDEGLDLLAAYRSVIDDTVRTLIMDFVQAVAKLQYNESERKNVIRLVKPDETGF